jgi:5-methyltetrahydrofolate--homocysteine methyltransferase
MGTMLQQAGLPVGASPEAWNLERPEAVLAVHRAYREAGAEILQTNTFGATRTRLAACGLADRVAEVNRAAVTLAREAAAGRAYVAGTIGPAGRPNTAVLGEVGARCPVPGARRGTGANRSPMSCLVRRAGHRAPGTGHCRRHRYTEQVEALLEAGVDLFIVETICDPHEGAAAVEAIRSVSDLPILATLTVDPAGRTLTGAVPEDAAALLLDAGADGIGANCSHGPASLDPVLAALRAAFPGVPLVAQPNAGLPAIVNGRPTYSLTPEAFAAWAARTFALAPVLGGCCGTTPAHMAAAAVALASSTWPSRHPSSPRRMV